MRTSYLIQSALIIALMGCGDNNKGTDNSTSTDLKNLISTIWITSECSQDTDGNYYKSLLEFNASGDIFSGRQTFHDTSCATPESETAWPSDPVATYTLGNSLTLQDGMIGSEITIDLVADYLINNIEGLYAITMQNNLCFSGNFLIDTDVISQTEEPIEPINYDNCLTAHGLSKISRSGWDGQEITKIVYSFRDSSIPPPYHRSYTITVTQNQSHIVVDSYGDIIADQAVNISDSVIEDLVNYLDIHKIEETDILSQNNECDGGTSKSLTVYSDEVELLNGYITRCYTRPIGNLLGDMESFAILMTDTIPNFTDLLESNN